LPKLGQRLYQYGVGRNARKFDFFIACDAISFRCLLANDVSPSQIIVPLLEGLEPFSEYSTRLSALRTLLAQCRFTIVASEDRGLSFEDSLQGKLNYRIMPVSLRGKFARNAVPQFAPCHSEKANTLRLVQSGYFAPWTMLFEVAGSLANVSDVEMVFQGHAMAAEDTLVRFSRCINDMPHMSIDSRFFADDDHLRFLSSFDAGIACYPEATADDSFVATNWRNLLYSSGKIATYLWAGLPVITNIVCEETRSWPFLYVSQMNASAFQLALAEIRDHRLGLRRAAREFAESHFEMDKSLNNIFGFLHHEKPGTAA